MMARRDRAFRASFFFVVAAVILSSSLIVAFSASHFILLAINDLVILSLREVALWEGRHSSAPPAP